MRVPAALVKMPDALGGLGAANGILLFNINYDLKRKNGLQIGINWHIHIMTAAIIIPNVSVDGTRGAV